MLNATPSFRSPGSHSIPGQSNFRSAFSSVPFPAEASPGNFATPGSSMAAMPSSEPVKKKRGRPRKYGPDGKVPLGLLPKSLTRCSNSSPGSDPLSPKHCRGRPPGTGRKQRLAKMGGWMNTSAGQAFAPHVIIVRPGEDVAAKVMSFSQQRPRAVCILAGGGTVSAVTLCQPESVNDTITFEGRFEILCLSGLYLVDDGRPRDRIGGISVSLSSPDGNIIGGSVGMLTAAGLVQVVVGSFLFGDAAKIMVKNKQVDLSSPGAEEGSKPRSFEKPDTKSNNHPHHIYTPSAISAWPLSRSIDMKNAHHHDNDLTRG